MLRLLLWILFLLFCPALACAQDDFCGPKKIQHACPWHVDQVCACEDHEFCLRLASDSPMPGVPAPPRFEVLCPPWPEPILCPLASSSACAIAFPTGLPICPSLAPEPPPPRA